MRIRIWNAFASNNSGSYVIVGSFPTKELAADTADELLAAAKAQSQWIAGAPSPPSPLDLLARKHGVSTADDGEWPAYSEQDHPAVWVQGHQVFLHSDYTTSMPRLLGHFIYARGGRVEIEINHAHHAIVSLFEMWFPWQERKTIDVPSRIQDIVDALSGPEGPLTTLVAPGTNAAWQAKEGFGEGDLLVGAVFPDLCAGCIAVSEVAARHGAHVRVKLFEALSEQPDPLDILRPCSPTRRQPT